MQTAQQVSGIISRGLQVLNAAGTVSFYADQKIDGVELFSDGRVDFRKHVSDVSLEVTSEDGRYEFRTISRGRDVYGGFSDGAGVPRCWYHFNLEPGVQSSRWRDHPVVVLLQDMQARPGGSPSQVHVKVDVPLDAAVFTSLPRLATLHPGTIPEDLMVPAEIEIAQSNDTNWRKGEIKLLTFAMSDVLNVAERHGIDFITPGEAVDGDRGDGYRAVGHSSRNRDAGHLRSIIAKSKVELTYTGLGNPVPAPVPDEDEMVDVDPYRLDDPGSCEGSTA